MARGGDGQDHAAVDGAAVHQHRAGAAVADAAALLGPGVAQVLAQGLQQGPVGGDGDLVGLFLLARSAGLYSARYDRPLWLWAAANSWGLSQASQDPGSVSDAVANGLYLSLLVRQGGGDLQGIAAPGGSTGLFTDSAKQQQGGEP